MRIHRVSARDSWCTGFQTQSPFVLRTQCNFFSGNGSLGEQTRLSCPSRTVRTSPDVRGYSGSSEVVDLLGRLHPSHPAEADTAGPAFRVAGLPSRVLAQVNIDRCTGLHNFSTKLMTCGLWSRRSELQTSSCHFERLALTSESCLTPFNVSWTRTCKAQRHGLKSQILCGFLVNSLIALLISKRAFRLCAFLTVKEKTSILFDFVSQRF